MSRAGFWSEAKGRSRVDEQEEAEAAGAITRAEFVSREAKLEKESEERSSKRGA